jgi:hypothetical protein
MKETTVLVHEPPSIDPSADSFRGFEKVFKDAQLQRRRDLTTKAEEHRQEQVKGMIAGEITDAAWDGLVDQAQKAAERGERQYLLLRFPSDLCTDDSRAINNPPNPTWPETLRGEAADIYERWHAVLRPLGFDLSAQVLDFPGGKPGDLSTRLYLSCVQSARAHFGG